MNDDETRAPSDADDPAFARLRAADPAAGAEPDIARVRAALAGVTASAGATSARAVRGDDDVVVEEITVDELAAHRARRRPARWLQVAAAVAGVVVIGGAGYVAGDQARSGSTGTAAPAISLENPAAAPESARDAAGASSMAATDKASAWFGGRTVFSSSGLSDEGGSGKAWALDAASVFSAATAAHLAEVLHVPGEPVQQYGTWTVGPQDGSGPTVSLSPDGTASMSYYDPTRDPWSCVKSAPDEIQGSSSDGGAGADGSTGAERPIAPGEPTGCAQSGAPAPDADAAKAQAGDLLSALGADPAAFELEAADSGTSQAASVNAYQVVDGARTGVTWSFTIMADGVQSAWGSLAPLVELGTYDVVSPAAAVERLGDPRFGASSGGMMPLAADARGAAEGATTDMMPAPEATPTVPATPKAGARLGWPVQEVVITSARLGVALTTLPDGAAVLVPTYELASADGSTWSVIAVVDDQLDFSAAG
jgi:hypothetical protein